MSMLSLQADELRTLATSLGVTGVCTGDLSKTITMLREAADTIESLRDRLQTSDGQSCYATQANYEHCKYSTDRGWRDTSRYSELFGTPERAVRTLFRFTPACRDCALRDECEVMDDCLLSDYDALLVCVALAPQRRGFELAFKLVYLPLKLCHVILSGSVTGFEQPFLGPVAWLLSHRRGYGLLWREHGFASRREFPVVVLHETPIADERDPFKSASPFDAVFGQSFAQQLGRSAFAHNLNSFSYGQLGEW